MRFSRKSSCIGVLVCLLAAVASWASINGSISGLVLDPSGSVIAGAAVTATETQTGVKSETVTDSKGFYNFPELPIGNYNVEISANGFKTFTKSGLVVDANAALHVDATLQVGQTTEKVVVNGDAGTSRPKARKQGKLLKDERLSLFR